jgi:hypothetical protein
LLAFLLVNLILLNIRAYLGEFDTLGLDLSGMVEAGGLLQGTARRLLCLVNPGHQQSQQTFKTNKEEHLEAQRHKDYVKNVKC